jgi:hypothetical protein
MTYDPGRDPQNPLDVHPKQREFRDETPPKAGMSTGLWVGIAAALAIAIFVMFNMAGNDQVATDNRPVTNPPATTGAGTTAPPPAARDGQPNSTALPGITPSTVPSSTRP